MFDWHAHGVTDRGLQRRRNEDALLVAPASRICAVADGMGGHAAGDVASRLAVETLEAAFQRPPSPRIRVPALSRRLHDVFEAANRAILEHAATNRQCYGMGTTMTALSPLVIEPRCVIAHIGDSRAYRFRRGELVQLTRDHTWVQTQVDSGILTPLQARHHKLSSMLTRVLGTHEAGPADIVESDVESGDLFLLCSDGVTTMLDDADLRLLLDVALPLDQLAAALVAEANRRGGADNITVVLAQASAA
ncbi:MAG TPA: protein phosphatase 2C domain-containing protein [Longimicrobiales bacterium]|nr:protein phosphatase 2C domain-containing protein [Longimicrobiales bacterium]